MEGPMSERPHSNASLIRKTLDKLGWDARPKDVIASLAAEGHKVSAQQVSNEKNKRAGRAGVKEEELTLSLVKKVKALVDEAGSVSLVRKALDELEELTSQGPTRN
jgi:hypothetical protein